jgi:preprotein translocase SecE subunit
VARNRQRAKQRQAERRARRLAEESQPGADGTAARSPAAEPAPETPPSVPEIDDPRAAEPEPPVDPTLAVGAPPEDEGRSDTLLEDEPEMGDEHLEAGELEAEAEAEAEEGYAPRGRRAEHADEPLAKDRPRLVQFLVAVWAELQRVQWPDRQTLTTLTGVVLGFVLIAGGYLGLLDAIFSRVIQAIL